MWISGTGRLRRPSTSCLRGSVRSSTLPRPKIPRIPIFKRVRGSSRWGKGALSPRRDFKWSSHRGMKLDRQALAHREPMARDQARACPVSKVWERARVPHGQSIGVGLGLHAKVGTCE